MRLKYYGENTQAIRFIFKHVTISLRSFAFFYLAFNKDKYISEGCLLEFYAYFCTIDKTNMYEYRIW